MLVALKQDSPRSDFAAGALCFGSRAVGAAVHSMKMIFASILTTILIVAMTLGAMYILLRATIYVTAIDSPLQRAGAIVAELLLGVVLLLGTVWLATHLAVRIFSSGDADGQQTMLNGTAHKPSSVQGEPLA
jgi:heme/copper-type cytochrome/quinol oxidase subunit 3